jgi:acyl-coenzyme A synthetase/AMP-(fatty) acid ligase
MAAVVGVKHEDRGEVPKAFVTLVEGSEVTEEELISFIDSKVNDFKKLRGGLKIVERMPKTHSGKIKKSQLRDDPLFY